MALVLFPLAPLQPQIVRVMRLVGHIAIPIAPTVVQQREIIALTVAMAMNIASKLAYLIVRTQASVLSGMA
jgi:hypothetical protein